MMYVKKMLILLGTGLLALSAGCTAQTVEKEAVSPVEIAVVASAEYLDASIDLTHPDTLPAGVTYDSGKLTIEQAGVYHLSGTMTGRVAVNADGPVELILAGVTLTGDACLEILSSDPVTLTLAKDTLNRLSDGADAPDKSAQAVVLSKAPLTIDGEGTLLVTAGANNAIQSKDDLTISGGKLTITAANHGLKSRGTLTVEGGILSVTATGEAITAESSRTTAGNIALLGGQVSVTSDSNTLEADDSITIAGGAIALNSQKNGLRATDITLSGGQGQIITQLDGVQADNSLTVTGGDWDITTGTGGGGAINQSGDSFGPGFGPGSQVSQNTDSCKGLKSDSTISITGGTINLNTQDDAIHCGLLCTIDGGAITICAGDDAIHADDMLVINGGEISIEDCFEGLEAFAIEVTGGDLVIRSVNDGINANGSEGFGFGGGPGGFGQQQTTTFDSISGQTVTYFHQSGGTIDLVVTGNYNNAGDGVDSNGGVTIDGGVLMVSTLGNTQEGGIDIGQGDLVFNGGMVLAGGASMMQEGVSTSSTQCSAVLTMDSQPAGTVVTLTDSQGQELWSVTMANTFNCLVLTHPDLQPGQVYTVTYGDSATTLDFTSTTVINQNSFGSGFGFGGGFGGFGGGPGRP
jgi:hypothetical protein